MTRKYMDEEIRRMINQVEQQEEWNNQNIYEGVTVNNQHYQFQEMYFFEDRLKIHLPSSFFDMPIEAARMKYPSDDRPQVIKTDYSGSVNVTLNLIPNNVTDEQIDEVKEGVKTIVKRLNPSYLFLEEGTEVIEGKTIGFFEFKSLTIDDPLYNFMFFVELDHDVMMGNISCPYYEYLVWRPVARQMMQSIRVYTKPIG